MKFRWPNMIGRTVEALSLLFERLRTSQAIRSFKVVACLLAASAQAGFFSGRPQVSGHSRSFGPSSGNHHTEDLFQGGAILLVKQSPSPPSPKSHRNQIGHRSGGHGYNSGGHGHKSGGHGRSLTVSGPTHVVRTIHHIQRVDNGGQILAR